MKNLTIQNIWDDGFLNGISSIYHQLKGDDQAKFGEMVKNTIGDENLKDAIAAKTFASPADICPEGCICPRGQQPICDGKNG